MMAYIKEVIRGGCDGVTMDNEINNQLGRGEINYATILAIISRHKLWDWRLCGWLIFLCRGW